MEEISTDEDEGCDKSQKWKLPFSHTCMYTNVRFIFQFVFSMHVVCLTDFLYVMRK